MAKKIRAKKRAALRKNLAKLVTDPTFDLDPKARLKKRAQKVERTLDQIREHEVACGDCKAGIQFREVKLANGNKAAVIEKCDVCLLFETNADAIAAAEVMLDMLDVEYASGDGTVADAIDRILDLVKSAAGLRENMRQEDADAEYEDYPVLGKIKAELKNNPPTTESGEVIKRLVDESLDMCSYCERTGGDHKDDCANPRRDRS